MSEKDIFNLSGKVALITGASRGLGVAFAKAMASFGADVAAVGRDTAKLAETVRLVEKEGRRAVAIQADVTEEADIQNMVNETGKQMGKIDIFFNNAGITRPPYKIHEIATKDWDDVINTNLRGMFLGLKYVLPVMMKQKGGSIINIASIAGLRAEVPEVAPASYGASKAGIILLTQVAAMEYVEYGIRVNCIAPGMHKSELGRPRGEQGPDTVVGMELDIGEYCAKWVPMGRQAEADELAGLAVLLASDSSSYITGQVYVQDGGQSARL